MKIGIECQRIFRAGKHGMDVVALELLSELQRLDTVNRYVLFARDGPDRCVEETASFRKKILKGLTYADWEQLSLPAAVKKSGVQLLHCTSNTAPLFAPVPLLLTLHDIIYLEQPGFGGSAYQDFGNLYRRLIVPPAIRQATLILTVSEFEKKVIVDHCRLDPSKVKVIHNGVSARFHPRVSAEEKNRFRLKYNLPAGFILFLGNTAPKKNTTGMLTAYVRYCERQGDALPLVVADYPRSAVQQTLHTLGRSHLADSIVCPGYIPSAEMPLLYNCSSLFVYPSLRESFGLPVLEAMACGVPVVASDTSAIPEVCGDAALLADPTDPRAMPDAIYRLINDSSLSKELIQKGFARAEGFSWKTAALKLLDVYKTLTAS